MFTKILIPMDFSPEAGQIVNYAIGLRNLGLKEIVIVHVIDVGRTLMLPVNEEIKAAIADKLAEEAEKCRLAGIKAKTIMREGDPTTEILKEAQSSRVSLILSGSHGKKLVDEFLHGSVSEELGRKSPVPVLLIRYDLIKDEDEKKLRREAAGVFKKILVPDDFTSVSNTALKYARKLKKAGAEEIILLHIVDEKRLETEQEKRELMALNENLTKEAATSVRRSRLKVKTYLQAGDPLTEIRKVADKEDVSLIVMGSHGKGLVKEWLVGSVSLSVIRVVNRPALLIHQV